MEDRAPDLPAADPDGVQDADESRAADLVALLPEPHEIDEPEDD